MEKFYIVTNEKFLKEINDYRKHGEERRIVTNNFFKDKGIAGNEYYIGGDAVSYTHLTLPTNSLV